LFGTFTHRKNRYDINARVTSATYYSQLSKRSHLQPVSWVAKTCASMSRLVANASHPVNNHYNSNPDTFWTNHVFSSWRKNPWKISSPYKQSQSSMTSTTLQQTTVAFSRAHANSGSSGLFRAILKP